MFNKLSGKEGFTFQNQKTGLNILEYWQWLYSDIYDLQDTLAEYIVAKALGKEEPNNIGSWTLYDIDYRGKRIEVKETSYYHSWQTDEDPNLKLGHSELPRHIASIRIIPANWKGKMMFTSFA